MNILIIEDSEEKIKKLKEVLNNHNLTIKESFHSGLKELLEQEKKYSFLILDMTIPLWDEGCNDLGGNYEQFGGQKILREMLRRKITVPTVLFTMFDIFPSKNGNLSFNELNENFLMKYSTFFKGSVYYDGIEENWVEELRILINEK